MRSVRGDHKVGRTELQCPFAPCSPEAAKINLRLRLSHGGTKEELQLSIGKQTMAHAYSAMDYYFDHLKKTVASAIQDILRIQMEFVRSQLEAFGEQAKELGEAYIKAASGQPRKPPQEDFELSFHPTSSVMPFPCRASKRLSTDRNNRSSGAALPNEGEGSKLTTRWRANRANWVVSRCFIPIACMCYFVSYVRTVSSRPKLPEQAARYDTEGVAKTLAWAKRL